MAKCAKHAIWGGRWRVHPDPGLWLLPLLLLILSLARGTYWSPRLCKSQTEVSLGSLFYLSFWEPHSEGQAGVACTWLKMMREEGRWECLWPPRHGTCDPKVVRKSCIIQQQLQTQRWAPDSNTYNSVTCLSYFCLSHLHSRGQLISPQAAAPPSPHRHQLEFTLMD